jgi:hypothetical protein
MTFYDSSDTTARLTALAMHALKAWVDMQFAISYHSSR